MHCIWTPFLVGGTTRLFPLPVNPDGRRVETETAVVLREALWQPLVGVGKQRLVMALCQKCLFPIASEYLLLSLFGLKGNPSLLDIFSLFQGLLH